jgi:3-hydroxyacyl-CoA dehydrogenase
MEKEGEKIPANVKAMLKSGQERFYEKRRGRTHYYDFEGSDYVRVEESPELVILPSPSERKRVVKSNPGGRLIDMGDGVACLEFRSANNVIDGDVIQMLHDAVAEVDQNFEGMVIGNQGANFCPGADVKLIYGLAMQKDWKTLEQAVDQLQQATLKLKYSVKPVVAAPFRMTLGGGCEICLASSMVRAYAEAYMGLVEMGVGIIPAGGGTKEMLLRAIEWVPPSIPSAAPGGAKPDLIPFVARAFETIATARVSTSAMDAQGIGYMRPSDRVSMNLDHLLHDAKDSVLSLVKEGYRPPRPKDDIRVVGRTGRGILELMVFMLKDGGYISEADAHIASRLAYVLTGGELDQNTLVTEQYILDLEREVVLSLAGEEKTQARLRSMAETGRPLRN